ncbi:hypothetical protein BofuT4_uP041400.1 [Botrytis cinerea T4]|uniref:Uncharacterized protein n=1 Tax=Botryotinia fuckeliana (strain T4) TaxID=999810 RepID=G2Y1I9_BOTF4|nr:hypothetical protein BofuT4_uP041400.1 [Botrytis cinerea T4]
MKEVNGSYSMMKEVDESNTGDGDGDGTLEVPMPDIDNLGKERSRQLSGLQRRRISKRVTQTERVRAATLGQSYH